MRAIIAILSIAIATMGCANSLWIMKDYDSHVGKIRYQDEEDRANALEQAALWCAPGKVHVMQDGHYETVISQHPLHSVRHEFSYVQFRCEGV